jgi:type VI secretion system protein ImpK
MGLVDGLARDLARTRSRDVEVLSPAGERPPEAIGRGARAGPLLWIAAGAIVLSLVIYVGLRVSLAAGTGAVEDQIAASANR